MIDPTITIPLDPQRAQAYNSASAEEKRKMQTLLGLWLRELVSSDQHSLQQILDEAGRKARARGLTPDAGVSAERRIVALLVCGVEASSFAASVQGSFDAIFLMRKARVSSK